MSYLVTAPLVLALDQEGRTHHHYRGDIIEWLSDEQTNHLLTSAMVEQIGPREIVAITEAQDDRQQRADETHTNRVRACIDVLNEIELPLTAGAPTARAAVRAHGHRFSNHTIADAVQQRRELSRTPSMPAWPVVAEGQAPAHPPRAAQ